MMDAEALGERLLRFVATKQAAQMVAATILQHLEVLGCSHDTQASLRTWLIALATSRRVVLPCRSPDRISASLTALYSLPLQPHRPVSFSRWKIPSTAFKPA